jgi:hypothetical protein
LDSGFVMNIHVSYSTAANNGAQCTCFFSRVQASLCWLCSNAQNPFTQCRVITRFVRQVPQTGCNAALLF